MSHGQDTGGGVKTPGGSQWRIYQDFTSTVGKAKHMYYVRQGRKKKSSANQKVSLEAWSQNGNFPLNAYK